MPKTKEKNKFAQFMKKTFNPKKSHKDRAKSPLSPTSRGEEVNYNLGSEFQNHRGRDAVEADDPVMEYQRLLFSAENEGRKKKRTLLDLGANDREDYEGNQMSQQNLFDDGDEVRDKKKSRHKTVNMDSHSAS